MSQQLNSSRLRACARRLSGYLTVLAALLLTLAAPVAFSQTACKVLYTISPQNSSAFGAALTIENTGTTAWTRWTLTWTFANGQTITSLWNGNETQSGANVTVTNESYNGSVAAGSSYTSVGFNGTWNGVTNAVPTSFAVNGTSCGGSVSTGSFSLTPSASALSVTEGSSATETIKVTEVSPFAGSVTLAVSGLPTGITATFGTNPTTGSSVVTFSAFSTSNAGTSTVTITGTSGALTASTTIALTVTAVTTCTQTAIVPYISVNGGTSWTEESSATVSSTTVVDLGPQPTTGGTWAWTGTNGFTSSTRQLDGIALSTGVNVYTATYTNASGCASTQAFTITVTSGTTTPSFTLAPSASSLSIVQGTSGTDTITVTDAGGFTSSVTLAASGLPSGVTAAFGTDPTTGSSVLTLAASSSAAAGSSTVTVTGTSGSLSASTAFSLSVTSTSGGGTYTPPTTARVKYNFDMDWLFIRKNVSGAQAVDFNDSSWTTVSTPHTFNDVDSYRCLISHSGGDTCTWTGQVWYRKHFQIPSSLQGDKIYLEFEGMRQAGTIYLNGTEVGLSENGITAYGVDISSYLNYGATGNVLAVMVDNTTTYEEQATGSGFEWNRKDLYPDYGGINHHVNLWVMGTIHQTLPLYYGLGTQGAYVYATDFNISAGTATITVESEVANQSSASANVTMQAVVVNQKGAVVATLTGTPTTIGSGATQVLSASLAASGLHWWSPSDPYLYTVYTNLSVNGTVVDSSNLVTGFREVQFKGGAETGGVWINGEFTYLKGYAQRSENNWEGQGQAYPDWMHDYNAQLIRNSNSNYVRWMHVSPQRVDVSSFDHFGIVNICPAGDAESDVTGVQWNQRVAVMTDSIIYFRNHPSILFYEAGNNPPTATQMQQMLALQTEWDPYGQRAMGNRDGDNATTDSALNDLAQYYGVEVGESATTDALSDTNVNPADQTDSGIMFRGYSALRRNTAPLIEAEDFRDEAARRYWDKYSPPFYGFTPGPDDTYDLTQETMTVGGGTAASDSAGGGAGRWYWYWANRISNPDTSATEIFGQKYTNKSFSKWSGYASIYFSDSDADGRQDSSEVARVSGKVDAVRLPKEMYYATRVMGNPNPDIHIVGHWSYPAGTVKTVYVISNTQSVELVLNGASLGTRSTPVEVAGVSGQFVFEFPNVTFASGTLTANGINSGATVVSDTLTTAGAAEAIRLTPYTAPGGMRADGEDVVFIDVEVIDANGNRVPTDDAQVNFTFSGPGIWRGGYNSGIVDSTNNLYLNTECGINRVSVRSTLTPGTMTVTASRSGLTSATVSFTSTAVPLTNGLSTSFPQDMPGPSANE
jgi:beta-galactosidase